MILLWTIEDASKSLLECIELLMKSDFVGELDCPKECIIQRMRREGNGKGSKGHGMRK